MAESLKRLHTAPRFRKDFDMFRLTEFYLRVCDEQAVPIPEGFRDRLDRVGEIERSFAVHPVSGGVPCHNDLLAENYIDDGRQLWIVDFEYSGNNDPCFELGDTAQECEFDQDLRTIPGEVYFGRMREDRLARMNPAGPDGGRRLDAVGRDPGQDLGDRVRLGWALERWERASAIFESEAFARWVAEAAGG